MPKRQAERKYISRDNEKNDDKSNNKSDKVMKNPNVIKKKKKSRSQSYKSESHQSCSVQKKDRSRSTSQNKEIKSEIEMANRAENNDDDKNTPLISPQNENKKRKQHSNQLQKNLAEDGIEQNNNNNKIPSMAENTDSTSIRTSRISKYEKNSFEPPLFVDSTSEDTIDEEQRGVVENLSNNLLIHSISTDAVSPIPSSHHSSQAELLSNLNQQQEEQLNSDRLILPPPAHQAPDLNFQVADPNNIPMTIINISQFSHDQIPSSEAAI